MLLTRALPLVVWAGLIFVGSSFSNPPTVTGDEWFSNLAHFCEYAGLGFLAVRVSLGYAARRPLLLLAAVAWAGCIAYGASDEFHQSFVPNRDSNAMDVGYDSAGAFVGIAVYLMVRRLPARRVLSE
jgi:VanZ family protein